MNFYETKMGNIFFNSQIPKLISALQDIASALSKPAPAINPGGTALLKPAPAIRMDSMADPDFLHDLLYWMYETEVFGNRGQFSRLDKDVTQAEAALLAVPGQSRELLEQYQQAASRRNDAEIERAFCCGYRAGIQMMLSGLSAPTAMPSGGTQDER